MLPNTSTVGITSRRYSNLQRTVCSPILRQNNRLVPQKWVPFTQWQNTVHLYPSNQGVRALEAKSKCCFIEQEYLKSPREKWEQKSNTPPMHTYTNLMQKKTVHRWTVISKMCYRVRRKNSAQLRTHSPFAGTHLHLLFMLLLEFHAPHFLPSQRERFQTMGPFHVQLRKGKDKKKKRMHVRNPWKFYCSSEQLSSWSNSTHAFSFSLAHFYHSCSDSDRYQAWTL